MIGFKMDEIMTGTHRFVGNADPEGEHPLHFSLTWGNKNIFNFLNPFSKEYSLSEARGFITVGGLVDKADCTGTLHLQYFTERKIRYEFTFKDDQGKSYHYLGEKRNIWPWNLHKTHVTCYGTITEVGSDKVISESVVYFPFREMVPFLLSFKFKTKGEVFTGLSHRRATMQFKTLSKREAQVLAAMAGGIIPRGGSSFELGAADLEEKWLPRADYLISRMPVISQLAMKFAAKLLNYLWPIIYMRKLTAMTTMTEEKRTILFHKIEGSGFFGTAFLLPIKAIVFPAFYGLQEVKEAIGYREKYSNDDNFEGIKK